jgi:hypothetical protein
MKSARDYLCVFTGRPADELHHASGKDALGVYLDECLLFPVVLRQHVVEHQGWPVAGVAEGLDADPNMLRLRRVGLLLVRLGEHHKSGLVRLPAESVSELGLMLHRVTDDLEASV